MSFISATNSFIVAVCFVRSSCCVTKRLIKPSEESRLHFSFCSIFFRVLVMFLYEKFRLCVESYSSSAWDIRGIGVHVGDGIGVSLGCEPKLL